MKKRYLGIIKKILFYSVMVILTFVILIPFIHIVLTSFKPSSDILSVRLQWIPKTLSLKQYRYGFEAEPMARYILNSIALSLPVVVAVLLIASFTAYSFARYKFKGDTLILGILLIMRVIPIITMLVPLFLVFGMFRLIDTTIALILAHIAFKLPLATWLLKVFFGRIPREIEESARIDGCSTTGIIVRIVLPLSKPGLAAAGTIAFLYTWNDLMVALALATSPRSQTLPVGLANFIQVFNLQWGALCAGAVITVLPVVILAFVFGKQMIRGLTFGAIK